MIRQVLVMAAVGMLAGGWAVGVPPVSTDSLGNPEEPALRPVKWAGWGVYSLMDETRKGFMKGTHSSPVAMVYELGIGALRGTASVITHVAKGSVYAPLPDRSKQAMSYEEAAMALIRANASSEQAAQPAEPAEPAKAEEQPEDPGAKYRQPAPSLVAPPLRKALQEKRVTPRDNEVTAAQRKYVPHLLVNYRAQVRKGRGDLTKLAD